MFGNALFSFFLGMPAVVVLLHHRRMRHPLARAILLFGGIAAVVAALLLTLPLFLCSGSLLNGYTACPGGDTLAGTLGPAGRWAGYLYLFAGPPLAGLALVLDRFAQQRDAEQLPQQGV